jgi:hypothetical protein
MNENQEVEVRKRRSGEEVKRLVVEFEASGLRRNEFCRTRGIALGTLRRHLKKQGAGEAGVKGGKRLVAVELARKDRNRNSRTAGVRFGSGSMHWSADRGATGLRCGHPGSSGQGAGGTLSRVRTGTSHSDLPGGGINRYAQGL